MILSVYETERRDKKMQVGDWMDKNFEKILTKFTVGETKKILKNEDSTCGIICDGDKFVGIVKSDKILGVDDKLPILDFVDRIAYILDPQDTLDEAAVFFLESDMEKLPVLDDGSIVGVLDLFQILDAFTQMAGFGEGGIRLEVELKDTPGELKKLLDILYTHSLNILSVLIHPSKEMGKRIAILRANGKSVRDLAKILEINDVVYRSIIKEEEM